MNLDFFIPKSADAERIAPFYYMRPNKACDSGVIDTIIWRERYDIRVSIADDKALLFLMKSDGEYFSAMPFCKEEDLKYYFSVIEKYFNEVLKKPLKMYLADEEAVETLALKDDPRYYVKEEADLKDYLYKGDDLRNLSGKKFHKKKNLVNKFFKEYEGRWEYRTLHCCDREDVLGFLDKWYEKRTEDERETGDTLEYEVIGIHEMMKECFSLKGFRAGGIFIDGHLQAFSLGSLNPRENMACIAIEKGNSEIPGIYQVINQQFLIHEFPDAELINREDDMGLPGLRKAKESYNPIGYERKYMVLQKDFKGCYEALTP
ncbi:MAG: phosphatidylglycerol lysyltransferase domain-containing protein [Oribacterium sp.]|nr:phosphatidylglycerol lysyltransferase domain-containing protein [Oribacterium sp.]